jgi:hypothetical protein
MPRQMEVCYWGRPQRRLGLALVASRNPHRCIAHLMCCRCKHRFNLMLFVLARAGATRVPRDGQKPPSSDPDIVWPDRSVEKSLRRIRPDRWGPPTRPALGSASRPSHHRSARPAQRPFVQSRRRRQMPLRHRDAGAGSERGMAPLIPLRGFIQLAQLAFRFEPILLVTTRFGRRASEIARTPVALCVAGGLPGPVGLDG